VPLVAPRPALLEAERLERRPVEGAAALEVADADRQVVDDDASLGHRRAG
jgi:hypothetical protein